MATIERRTVLGAMAASLGALGLPDIVSSGAEAKISAVGDEAYWARIAAQYDVTGEVIQLENGNWGMMSRPVIEAYKETLERVNRDTSYYARRGMGRDLLAAREELAAFLKVDPDEIAFTRNATEALKALIGGYNHIAAGQSALIADLDYGSMQASMVAAMARRGAKVVRIDIPEPATHENVIAAYERAFDAVPSIRLVLLTHISHRTGLMVPVAEIVALARSRGIDVIVDAAHSLGHADYALPDLGADFVGLNLHKWIGAPLGVGAVYIRRSRIAAIDTDIADEAPLSGRVDSRVHTGTVDFAALLSVSAALRFQADIGSARRAARLRALRDHWVHQVRRADGIEVLTPDDPRMHGGITSFRFRGRISVEENEAVVAALLERFGIYSVHRTGLASGACVRITPALFNSLEDVDILAKALIELADD